MEKATFDDLIARKIQRERDKQITKDIEIPSLGKTLTFERPTDAEIIAFMDTVSSASGASGVYELYKNMIYRCCPILHADKVRQELEAVDPTDTVPRIMDVADVMTVGEQLSGFLGLLKIGDEVKN